MTTCSAHRPRKRGEQVPFPPGTVPWRLRACAALHCAMFPRRAPVRDAQTPSVRGIGVAGNDARYSSRGSSRLRAARCVRWPVRAPWVPTFPVSRIWRRCCSRERGLRGTRLDFRLLHCFLAAYRTYDRALRILYKLMFNTHEF